MKKTVGLIFGGRSAEHDVSILSAANIIAEINKKKFRVLPIYITKCALWFPMDPNVLLSKVSVKQKLNQSKYSEVILTPSNAGANLVYLKTRRKEKIDIFFPIVHGPYGEDGSLPGLLRMMGSPYVGSGVIGSAVSMDKDVMKRLLIAANIPVAKYVAVRKNEKWPAYESLLIQLGPTMFVKPANMGSSVGVSKVTSKESYETAMHNAFDYDQKILIEEGIKGKEVECAVMGNDSPIASTVGQLQIPDEFYSYDKKYIHTNDVKIIIPLQVSNKLLAKISALAIQTYKTLECKGFARVDFFLKENGEVIVNELNSVPGFTANSMFPKLFQAGGYSYSNLLTSLLEFGLEEYKKDIACAIAEPC